MKPPRDKMSEPKKQAVSQPRASARLGHNKQQAQVKRSNFQRSDFLDSDFLTQEEQASIFSENAENLEKSEEMVSSPDIELMAAQSPATEDDMEFHFGSREETNAALEEKIATQNTLKLHERL